MRKKAAIGNKWYIFLRQKKKTLKYGTNKIMKKHSHYDLWIHDDTELSELPGDSIIQRQTIHEWPNSCVQKILLESKKTIIYKYQSGGIADSLFYEKVNSPKHDSVPK